MGWKASMIVINSEEKLPTKEVFEALGYYELSKVDKQPFEVVMNPEDDRIYVGQYNGNTIICMQDVPLESLSESVSDAEKILSSRFADTDVVTFALHSVVNLWGYSLVHNGKKLRARAGSSEGTTVEYGEMLEEEKELFSIAKKNAKGERIFVFDDMPEEEFADDQLGENFVFDISTKYFGESLDDCEELFEAEFQGYTFSRVKPIVEEPVKAQPAEPVRQPATAPEKAAEVVVKKKPWWKFW